jgi:pSer/pThr/pTyr-binding forkhead associated (FHA) protein
MAAVASAPAAPSVPSVAPQDGYTKGCPNCGALNRPTARFCRACGHVYVQPLPPVLRVVRPAGANWEYPLRASTLIGRPGGALPVDLDLSYYDGDSPVLLPKDGSTVGTGAAYVSRNHARIAPGEGANQRRFTIADLGSANGTFVNGERLEPRRPRLLRDGDRIRMGRIVLRFGIR